MTIVSPLLCGGFAESGRIEAGPLSFEIAGRDSPTPQDGSASQNSSLVTRHSSLRGGDSIATTLWVTSLDGAPLPCSSRMLLVHLTDVQGEGTRYADEARQIITKWGKGCLAECGEAEVALRLDESVVSPALSGDGARRGGAALTVFALDTAGNRTGEVPSRIEDGILRFHVSTRGPDGKGRIYYEIAR